MRRDDWSSLMLFNTIAEERNFTRAAKRLGVSPSALSHSMRQLEERLGIRLLNRTTRSVAPTEAGERLLKRLAPVIDLMAVALDELNDDRDRPVGRLRISAHRSAAMHVILPLLRRFGTEYPEITVELVIEDGLVDIVAQGYDAGVRHGHVLEQDMIQVRISDSTRVAYVATAEYFASRGLPKVPQDLLNHQCVNYRYTTSGALHRWTFEKDGQSLILDPPSSFVSNDIDVLKEAVLSGMGIGSLSDVQVAGEIASGALVRILEDWSTAIPPNYLYFTSRRHISGPLRAFIEALKTQTLRH